MVSVQAAVLAPEGAVLPRAELPPLEGRRVTRTATLDGGAVLTDQGWSAGDLRLAIREEQVSAAQVAAVRALLRGHAQVVVSHRDGCHLATLRQLTVDATGLELEALVLRALS